MIKEVLGYVPMPEVEDAAHFVEYLFDVGPTLGEDAITWGEMDSWSRRTGLDLEPWQYRLLVSLSRAYLVQMHESRQRHAIAPWPKARNMWKYVQDQKHGASLQASLNDKVEKGKRNVRRK